TMVMERGLSLLKSMTTQKSLSLSTLLMTKTKWYLVLQISIFCLSMMRQTQKTM
ncbi:putative RTX toxin domain protein, partial [Vibrio parahaemolyticus VPTS-2010_2]